jgi:hypothetical protein
MTNDFWYAVPLVVATSLVYAATRHEYMRPILIHAVRAAVWITGFMAVVFAILFWISWHLRSSDEEESRAEWNRPRVESELRLDLQRQERPAAHVDAVEFAGHLKTAVPLVVVAVEGVAAGNV